MYTDKEKRLFISNYDDKKWDRVFYVNHILEEELSERHIENGILLPLKVRTDIKTENEAFEGGIVAQDFSFVAGIKRHYEKENANRSVCIGYEVPGEEIVHRDETVVFGGIVYNHFGDELVMGTTRLWWFAEHQDTPYKFVFLRETPEDKVPEEFFRVLGLTPDRYEVVDEPTSFREIIVPDESCYILTHASRKWLEVFDLMKVHVREKLAPSPYEKVYLSRTDFHKYGKGDGINEEYYEKFFESRGFEVIHPENLPLEEQINVLMNAKEVACVFGTLSHLALFAENGLRQFNILRTTELWIHQAVINQVRDVDFYWFEGAMNPLPTSHDFGYFMYYPTRYFRAFLDSYGMGYKEEELQPEVPSREMVTEFIGQWAEHFADPQYNWRIKDRTSFDYLQSLYQALFGKRLEAADYQPTKSSEELKKKKNKIKELEKKLKEQEKISEELRKFNRQLLSERDSYKDRLKKTQSSISWKVTKPLRAVHEKLK